MKIITRLIIILALAPSLTFAGAAPAKLTCNSTGKGKVKVPVTLSGLIPDMYPELDLMFTMGKARTRITFKNSNATIIEAFKHGVFTMSIVIKGKELKLYALPRTVKIKRGGHWQTVRFAAVLQQAPKPEYKGPRGVRAYIHDVRMSCVYDWRL